MAGILLNIKLKKTYTKMVAAARDFQINAVIIHKNSLIEE
jgi:hypothetical protein